MLALYPLKVHEDSHCTFPDPACYMNQYIFSRKEWFQNKSFYENPDKPALLRANFAYLITVHVKILKFQHEYCMVRVSIINLGG